MCCLFFFLKQKTAYEMRISDWSSDVCSSDLLRSLGPIMAFWIAGAAESLSAMAHIVSFGPSLRPCGHPLRRTGPQMASLFPGRMKKAVDVGSSTKIGRAHV